MRFATSLLTAALLAPAPLGMDASNDAAAPVGVETRPVSTTTLHPRAYVQQRAARNGWKGREWRCLQAILDAESNFRVKARNGSHYGIFQQKHLPVGSSLATQTRLGLKYVGHRYGTPCAALRFRIQHGWY